MEDDLNGLADELFKTITEARNKIKDTFFSKTTYVARITSKTYHIYELDNETLISEIHSGVAFNDHGNFTEELNNHFKKYQIPKLGHKVFLNDTYDEFLDSLYLDSIQSCLSAKTIKTPTKVYEYLSELRKNNCNK